MWSALGSSIPDTLVATRKRREAQGCGLNQRSAGCCPPRSEAVWMRRWLERSGNGGTQPLLRTSGGRSSTVGWKSFNINVMR